MRLGLEHRLAEARKRLAASEEAPQPHPLSITFRGAPVEGSRSIDAGFATEAVKAFVDATSTVTASLVADELRDHGPLPLARDRSLRIVDTAIGSFGFELELPPPAADGQGDLIPQEAADPYVEAIATTLKLLGEAATDDDDAISDLVAEIHPRAAAKVRAFASVLAENDALFAVEFGARQVRFDNERQVKRVIEALADADISEKVEQHVGTILGLLPESRRYEARLADGRVLQGKVDRSVADIGVLKATWESRPATLRFRVIHVRTRRRFVLLAAAEPPR
ncbi:MAG: hypothetical protein KIT58_05940 [Planctomycetota bacterium]|nr:hypothetical protein [Planctomycetota bacterium]